MSQIEAIDRHGVFEPLEPLNDRMEFPPTSCSVSRFSWAAVRSGNPTAERTTRFPSRPYTGASENDRDEP